MIKTASAWAVVEDSGVWRFPDLDRMTIYESDAPKLQDELIRMYPECKWRVIKVRIVPVGEEEE